MAVHGAKLPWSVDDGHGCAARPNHERSGLDIDVLFSFSSRAPFSLSHSGHNHPPNPERIEREKMLSRLREDSLTIVPVSEAGRAANARVLNTFLDGLTAEQRALLPSRENLFCLVKRRRRNARAKWLKESAGDCDEDGEAK